MSKRNHASNGHHDSDHDSPIARGSEGGSRSPGGVDWADLQRPDGGGAEGLPRPPDHSLVRRALAYGRGCARLIARGHLTPRFEETRPEPRGDIPGAEKSFGPLPLRQTKRGRAPAALETVSREEHRLNERLAGMRRRWSWLLDITTGSGCYSDLAPWLRRVAGRVFGLAIGAELLWITAVDNLYIRAYFRMGKRGGHL